MRRPFSALSVPWIGYAVVLAALIAYYALVFAWGTGLGVDFACFRAAALVITHGGNPYDFGQLWRMENALYNVPAHLHPGAPAYYYLDRYYNPPLFATAMAPLARLPFAQGYALYSAGVALCAVAGTVFTLLALGWTRRRLLAVAIMLASPAFFIALRNGQQSTFMLFLLGAGLYALRRDRPTLAGALLALTWIKPHLLLPFALTAPLLFSSRRTTIRWYTGFFTVTALGLAATLATTGMVSIVAWIHRLFAYSDAVGVLNTSLPSLSGMVMDLLPSPANKTAATILTLLGAATMLAVVVRARRRHLSMWASMGVLVAAWLLFTPYAHANDGVLLLIPLAVAWGRDARRHNSPLPLLALWAFSALPLAMLLPSPLSALTVVPAALAFMAALHVQGYSTRSV